MPKIKEIEKRYITGTTQISARADGKESRTIEGYAFRWESWSKPMYWFKERIARGALDGCDVSDVVCVKNHNIDILYARKSGTLKLTPDEIGLRYRFDSPDTTAGNDLLVEVALKNIQDSSFRFIVKEDSWVYNKAEDLDERTVLKFDILVDVSPVVFPAYESSDVALAERSVNEMRSKREIGEGSEGKKDKGSSTGKEAKETTDTYKVSADQRSRHIKLLKLK